MQPVICILGATAVGKTDLALKIADAFPCHLISVDSAQVYRGLNIGSAKLSASELERYPHALIDILDPKESYSAAHFVTDAKKEIAIAHQQKKIPLLVGGSMLYFYALFNQLANLPPSNVEIRGAIMERLLQGEDLYAKLQRIDPQTAAKIAANDFKRLSRFWELIEVTGKTPSDLYAEQSKTLPAWDILALGLNIERLQLHQRIEKRFIQMIEQGFLQEVQQLHQRGDLTLQHPSIQSAGYQQLWRHLDGEYDTKTAIEQGIIATRQLAKRQVTWLNNKLREALPLQVYQPQDDLLPLVADFVSSKFFVG